MIYVCLSCDYKSTKWLGQCPNCKQWNSFEEREGNSKSLKSSSSFSSSSSQGRGAYSLPKKISEITEDEHDARVMTGIREFDRVLGGGIVPGSLVLVGGGPGIGKSTLLMMAMGKLCLAYPKETFFYISGEESLLQVSKRLKRLNLSGSNLYLYHETSWERIKEQCLELRPKVFVLDSIQTTLSDQVVGTAGGQTQLREVTFELLNFIKAQGFTCFVIGHITKEGNIAGPKILEHMVDTVIYFEGDQFDHYRILRSYKNRFGNTLEVGIFEMGEQGLEEVHNPAEYFLAENSGERFGRALSCTQEGTRTLILEAQGLVVENKFGNGRRTAQGIDQNRLCMLVAVIEKYFKINLSFHDIYVNIAGGIRSKSREIDLAIIASILSSFWGITLPKTLLFLGEVGLTGDIRAIGPMEKRLHEIEQLGYKCLVTSASLSEKFQKKFGYTLKGMHTIEQLRSYFPVQKKQQEPFV